MTERLSHHESHEKLHVPDLTKENLERAKRAAEQAEAHDERQSIEHLQHKVHEQAVSGREYTVGEREQAPAHHTIGAHKQLKTDSYKRSLSHIRARLNWSEKGFSKHIHRPSVEKADALVGNTVARPWGLLMGGLFAFTGSLLVLFFATYHGFRYNFGVFLSLFVGGYIVGSLLELVGRLILRRRRA